MGEGVIRFESALFLTKEERGSDITGYNGEEWFKTYKHTVTYIHKQVIVRDE